MTVNAGAETANINFIMGGVPGGVTGTVTRESDNSVVAGATVELRRTDTLVAQTVTDDNGASPSATSAPAPTRSTSPVAPASCRRW